MNKIWTSHTTRGDTSMITSKLLLISIVLLYGTNDIYAQSDEIETVRPLGSNFPPSSCFTRSCSDASRNILLGLDKTVDPCQNFHKHVCGNFEKNVELANGAAQANKFSILMGKIMDQIKSLVSQRVDPQEPNTFKLIKNYYQSCLNEDFTESQGLKPLDRILNKLNGWPVVLGDSWNGDNFTWEQADSILQVLGFTPKYIYQPYVMKDMTNPSNNVLYLKPLETKIESLQHDQNLLKAYQNYMVDIAVVLGADKDSAVREMHDTFTLEYDLFKATQSSGNPTQEPEKDRQLIRELQSNHPSVSWLEYLNGITSPISFFKHDEAVQLENPIYLRGVEEVLRRTSRRTLANYMAWRAIEESIEYLSPRIRNIRLEFDRVTTGAKKIDSREEVCIKKMLQKDEGLLPGISAMYVKSYFHDEAKNKVGEMVSDLHGYYKEILEQNSWLDPVTKKRALKKLKVMKRIIGYPEELSDINFIDKYYENVRLTPDNYFENARRLKKAVYLSSMSDLRKSPEETSWIEFAVAASVNVHYNRIYNAIVLPASVLQPPFFDKNQPNYVNYGSMGLFIGHELTHAFTFEDLPLDENGSFTRWWTDNDNYENGQKSICFVDHYDNFTVDNDDDEERESIGTVSLNENLADNQGFRVAINAYGIWRHKNGNEPRLSSLVETNQQLFWVSAASTLCTKRTEENKKLQRATDEHASEEIRVNGAVSNSAEFAKTFNCPVGSPMNPQQKCDFF